MWKGANSQTDNIYMMDAELINIKLNGKLLTKNSKAALLREEKSAELLKILVIDGSGGDTKPTVLNWITLSLSSVLISNVGYVLKNDLERIIITLPLGKQGDRLLIYNKAIGGFRLEQRANQQIRLGNKLTTIGVQGAVISYESGDFLEFTYLDGMWVCMDMFGNLEVL